MSTKLVLVRHGQSVWNKENRFTGWKDVDLTDQGREEARQAGELLKEAGFEFDMAYTSVLKRAIRTLWTILDGMDQMWIPVIRDYRLNERHYGALQGLNKAETAEKYGDEQVLIWRRSYDTPPPKMDRDDERYAGRLRVYKNLDEDRIPLSESLKDTVDRFLPYYQQEIEPQVRAGKQVLICAHGNSLRALVKHLSGISDEDIVKLNIPTGIPMVYELDDDLKPIKNYYLGDQEAAAKAAVLDGAALCLVRLIALTPRLPTPVQFAQALGGLRPEPLFPILIHARLRGALLAQLPHRLGHLRGPPRGAHHLAHVLRQARLQRLQPGLFLGRLELLVFQQRTPLQGEVRVAVAEAEKRLPGGGAEPLVAQRPALFQALPHAGDAAVVLVQLAQGGPITDIALEQIPRLAGRPLRKRAPQVGRHPAAQHVQLLFAQSGEEIIETPPHVLRDNQIAALVLAQGAVGHGAAPGRRLFAELASAGHIVLELGFAAVRVRRRRVRPGRRRFRRRFPPPHAHQRQRHHQQRHGRRQGQRSFHCCSPFSCSLSTASRIGTFLLVNPR